MASLTVHPSGLFQFTSVEYGVMDMGFISYDDCHLLQPVGQHEAGERFAKIKVYFEKFKIEFIKERFGKVGDLYSLCVMS